jgi:hypothetical protein
MGSLFREQRCEGMWRATASVESAAVRQTRKTRREPEWTIEWSFLVFQWNYHFHSMTNIRSAEDDEARSHLFLIFGLG